jgi:hypothetical protein
MPFQESMLFHSFRTKAAAVALACAMLAAAPAVAYARAHPTPTPSATPVPPPEDPVVTRVARREFVSWQAGSVDSNRYADVAKPKLQADKIASIAQNLGALGAFVRSEYIAPVYLENPPPGIKAYLYRMVCTEGAVYEEIILDAQGKVTGIVFRDKLEQ